MKRHIILLFSLLLALLCPAALKAGDFVIINQVMYDTPLSEVTGQKGAYNGEFIELYNAGPEEVSLNGWSVLSLSGKNKKETLRINNVSIPSGGYLLLASRQGSGNNFVLSDLYQSLANKSYTAIYHGSFVLANTKETLILLNAQNDTIDQVTCGSDTKLKAKNGSNTAGDDCISIHRSNVDFDENGKVLPNKSQWETDKVSFCVCRIAQLGYGDTFNHKPPMCYGTGISNSILTITPLEATDNYFMIRNGYIPAVKNIQFYDGLGRPSELVAIGATPNQHDLVTITTYNGLHRVAQQYLPMPISGDKDEQWPPTFFQGKNIGDEVNYESKYIDVATIQQDAISYFGDNRPFTETLYENSALDRIVGQKRPGDSYEAHPSSCSYSVNTETDIHIYTVNFGSLKTRGYYEPYTLYKTTTTDEDGNGSLITFTDKLGRKIMEERSGSRTYFVYDDLGRLCFVIPNLPKSKLTKGEFDLENATLKTSVYCYQYDARGNMIYKRLPECEPQYMVYDVMGQLVLKQDGNQRLKNEWTLFAYDSIGRNVYTAVVELTQNHDDLINLYADKWAVEYFNNKRGLQYESSIFGANNMRILTANYYDEYGRYGYVLQHARSTMLNYIPKEGYGARSGNATGLLTATRVYSLSGGPMTVTAYYYDDRGRMIQSRSVRSTDLYQTSTFIAYNFDGSIAKQLTIQGIDTDITTEHYAYTYDHAGRLKETKYQLNDEPEITLSAFSYDELGRLAQKLLYKKAGNKNYSDTITYSYDMRNMLTEAKNKHFSERLFYIDNPRDDMPYFKGCYNGNIAAATLTQRDEDYTFLYLYDNQNQLKESRQDHHGKIKYLESFDYDDAGNILHLERSVGTTVIDDLDLYYGNEGNQLLTITENGDDVDKFDVIEFANNTSISNRPLRYDANGNLIYDEYRGIIKISYNVLNLPDTIQFKKGHMIVNKYNAVGMKYQSVNYTNFATAVPDQYDFVHYHQAMDSVNCTIRDYHGNVIDELVVDNMECVLEPKQVVSNAIGYNEYGTFYHYIKDHLGSNCAVVNSETSEAVQSTIFYPSGVPMPASITGRGIHAVQNFGRDEQPYLYNGKEFIEAHGLNEYDSQARMYYATIMRTTTMDPLAEVNYAVSPYAWCNNDPINKFDPDGRIVRVKENDDSALDALYNTLNVTDQEFVSMDEQGLVNVDQEHVNNTESNNYKALAELAKSEIEYTIATGSCFQYKDENGNVLTANMGPIEIDPYWGTDAFGFDTNEVGWLGQTQTPGNASDKRNSLDNNVHVILNTALSVEGKAQTLSHELFGHALLYGRGWPHMHNVLNIGGKLIEQNTILRTAISTATAETKQNMRRK